MAKSASSPRRWSCARDNHGHHSGRRRDHRRSRLLLPPPRRRPGAVTDPGTLFLQAQNSGTNSFRRSRCLPRSSSKVLFSFPEPEPTGGMVEEPVPSDTRLSWVQSRETRIRGLDGGSDLIGAKEPYWHHANEVGTYKA
jgi:hypothetical protein